MKKIIAMLLAIVMVLGLVACQTKPNETPNNGGTQTPGENQDKPSETKPAGNGESGKVEITDDNYVITPMPATGKEGPIYDEYSEMTDEELYEAAKAEGGEITIYATSSKMKKEEETFEEAFPGLDLVVIDLDNDVVIDRCRTEAETGNITADVLQVKDVNGDIFYDFMSYDYCSVFYPKDICENVDPTFLTYGYPLYTSMAFWYYNTEQFPDGQPITSWWNLVEKNEDGSQKYSLYCKEIGLETAYLSLFASFILNADQMAASYEAIYGTPLEYTYDASMFDFQVPANNAGIEYLYRFSQLRLTFIGDGDDLVAAVHNNTDPDHPALALASAGKISNRDESEYNIAWCLNLTPYTALQNFENLYVMNGCDNPAGARLFIRYITGGADGESGGMKPFTKEGNWPVRSDVKDKKNSASLSELGATAGDLSGIYSIYLDCKDMWDYYISVNPNMK